MKINGHYLDGITSRRHSAYLEVGFEHKIHLYVEKDDCKEIEIVLNTNTINIESRLGCTPREISFGENEMFVTEDNAAIEKLMRLQDKSTFSSLLHTLESRSSIVITASVITIVVLWAVIVYGIPASAKFVAYQLPDYALDNMGSNIDILDKSIFDPSEIEPARQEEIQLLVAPYISQFKHINPRLYFRSGMRANALALPNGDIVFTDEFVRLAESDEELLAVFFHELGHLQHKHLTRRILQDSMVTLLAVLITGDVETADIMIALPTMIHDLSYSREFEVEADTYALEQMHSFGVSLDDFITIMQRLENYYHSDSSDGDQSISTPGFLSTHPATEDRIKMARHFIKKMAIAPIQVD